jgi:hypothetical protein
MQRNDNTPREERTPAFGDRANTESGLPPTNTELQNLRSSELYSLTRNQAQAIARLLIPMIENYDTDGSIPRLILLFRAVCYGVNHESEVLLCAIEEIFLPYVPRAAKALDGEVFDRLRAVKYEYGVEAREYVTGIKEHKEEEE